MFAFWRAMLWSLATVLVVGLLFSWLDVPPLYAQGDDVEVEVGEGLTIEDDPYLYWKCWRTETAKGSKGFTSSDITDFAFFSDYSAFATPEMPSIDGDRLDSRGHRLLDLGPVGGDRWKITRGDLIDGRFYRPTDLVEYDVSRDPYSYGTPGPYAFSDQVRLFRPFKDAGLAAWNPFLPSTDARIEDIRIEWNTGSGRAGESASDDVDRLQQEQAGGASVAEQSVGRSVPYRGSAEPFAGKLDDYAPINEDKELEGLNFHGGRNHYGTVSGQVISISGTVQTQTGGPNVTTVVSLDSTPQDVTNQQVSAETNDPVNPEIYVSTVSKAEDVPRLVMVGTTGYKDDDQAIPNLPRLVFSLSLFVPPGGFKPANLVDTRNRNNSTWLNYPVDACFFVKHKEKVQDDPSWGSREYRMLCWMVRSTSIPSSVDPQPIQTMVADKDDLGGDDFEILSAADFPGNFNGLTPLALNSNGDLEIPGMLVWEESDLDDTSDALYHESASRRRGALSPQEVDDSPDDEIIVGINLKAEYRGDPETSYTFTDDSGSESQMWKMFGNETVGRRVIRDGTKWYYAGYQQSYMLPFFWGGDGDPDDRVIPWMYDARHPLIEHFGQESLVLWPVYLKDMNYYLFDVRDFTKQHAGDRGHVLNLAYAGYTGLHKDISMAIAIFPLYGVIESIVQGYQGKRGQAVPVPVDPKGSSGRTGLIAGSVRLDPFTPGKLYYPFYDVDLYDGMVASDYAGYNHGSPVLLNSTDLLKAGVVSPDDAGTGPEGFGENSRFQWSIREGVPVGGLGGGNREEVYRRHGFDPSYVSRLASDGTLPISIPDPFSEFETHTGFGAQFAWPNAYISPDDTHLMILTFYEGRLANSWKFVPAFVPFDGNSDVANALYETASEKFEKYEEITGDVLATGVGWVPFVDGDKVKNALTKIEAFPELGAVPTFQYRRVICRVVIPPEGVVTPASGVTAVVDKLEDVVDAIVNTFLGAITKLISFIEKIPGELLVGLSNTVAEGACHGTGALASVGGGENDVGQRETAAPGKGTDLKINSIEHDDRVSQDACEEVRDKGVDTAGGPDCSSVGAAVGDPACSSIPSVDFTEVNGLKYKIDWKASTAVDYSDVWYYSYPGSDEPSPDLSFAEGFSLKEAVALDLGVPELTFELPKGNSQAGIAPSIVNVTDSPSPPDPRSFAINQAFQIAGSSDFDGYVLYVRPDRRTFRFVDCDAWGLVDPGVTNCDPPGFPRRGNEPSNVSPLSKVDVHRFFLPRYFLRYSSLDEVRVGAVENFTLGNVPMQATVADCNARSVKIHDGLPVYDCVDPPDEHHFKIGGVGNEKVAFLGNSDWEKLSVYLDYMWYLGSDAEISLAISAYRGDTDGDSWTEGPLSDWVNIKGGPGLACLDQNTYWATYWAEEAVYYGGIAAHDGVNIFGGSGDPLPFERALQLSEQYGCALAFSEGGAFSNFGEGSDYYLSKRKHYLDSRDSADQSFCHGGSDTWRCDPRLSPDSGPLRGVIAAQAVVPDLTRIYGSGYLFGSSICQGIWAGTPSGFTWDSKIVHTVWSVCWVLAIVLLFALLLWDGLSLTYAGWVGDGRGGATISSMIPRFTLALLLASASLLICRVVLTLSADIACFFVHATGTTFAIFMWTMGISLAVAIGGIFAAFFFKTAILALVTGGAWLVTGGVIVLVALCVILLTFLLFIGYYLLKVMGGMLVRIFLLMVLIGLAPIAFAFYASPSTEHWTKRWVSLLLGTAFQQVIVLIVLFIGASLADSVISSFGQDIWGFFMGLLGTLMILFLAAKVPDLVNPGARGMFAGFTQALAMSAAAGAMIGGGLIGAGAVAGGQAGGAAGSMARGAMGRMSSMLNRSSSVSGGARNAANEAMANAPPGAEPSGAGSQISSSQAGPTTTAGLSGDDLPSGSSGAGVSGGGGGGAGGGGGGGGGFFNRVGRGFMSGASRGGLVGRSMYNMQRGASFVSGDPSTDYSGNSLAQLQPFRNYVNQVDPGGDEQYQGRASSVREARGGGGNRGGGGDGGNRGGGDGGNRGGGDGGGGNNRRGYTPRDVGPENEVPDRGLDTDNED